MRYLNCHPASNNIPSPTHLLHSFTPSLREMSRGVYDVSRRTYEAHACSDSDIDGHVANTYNSLGGPPFLQQISCARMSYLRRRCGLPRTEQDKRALGPASAEMFSRFRP
jgi:hypothetical protein